MMKLINIICIAVALSMDAFAVSVASGAKLKKVSNRQTFRLSWHFGSVSLLSRCSGIVGGIILLAIGVNILREHSAIPF